MEVIQDIFRQGCVDLTFIQTPKKRNDGKNSYPKKISIVVMTCHDGIFSQMLTESIASIDSVSYFVTPKARQKEH